MKMSDGFIWHSEGLKRLALQTCKNTDLFGKGFNATKEGVSMTETGIRPKPKGNGTKEGVSMTETGIRPKPKRNNRKMEAESG